MSSADSADSELRSPHDDASWDAEGDDYESEVGSEGEDGDGTSSEEEGSCFHEVIVEEIMDYAMHYSEGEVTLEGLQQRIEQIPPDMLREKLLEYNVLHCYVGHINDCQYEGGPRQEGFPPAVIKLEVVEYLVELSPDAVNKSSDGKGCFERGAYPLHLACRNADCPVPVVKYLYERNPSAVSYIWEHNCYGLPLFCYLSRALNHPSCGYHDEDGEWNEQTPALPSGELDIDVVKMLVGAYPEALTTVLKGSTALHTLCGGYYVSLELAQALIDEDNVCLQAGGDPVKALLSNKYANPFPDDVFHYLLKCSPNYLEKAADLDDSSHNIRRKTLLTVACSNPMMSSKTIALMVESCPDMVKRINKYDGCLPLHTLCRNRKMEDQSATDILKVLISAYPESVALRVSGGRWLSDDGKFAINLAEESNKSFGFCEALLSEHEPPSRLQWACAWGSSLRIIKKLVEDDRGLLLMRGDNGNSVLHTAAECASLDVVKYLVGENDVDLTLPDRDGELPLHKACRRGRMDLVQYLMTRNMESIFIMNHCNELPIHVLCYVTGKSTTLLRSDGYDRTVYRMLKCFPKKNILRLASVCKCSLKIIRTFVKFNAELPWLLDDDGHLALHSAAEYASLNVVKYLLQQNRDALALPDHSGDLPLHKACYGGNLKVVKYLIEEDEACLLMPNKDGDLPLHKACRAGRFDVVGYLIMKNAASATVMNHRNELPLHILCSKSGESEDQLQSVEYVESIFKILLAYPDPVIVNAQAQS